MYICEERGHMQSCLRSIPSPSCCTSIYIRAQGVASSRMLKDEGLHHDDDDEDDKESSFRCTRCWKYRFVTATDNGYSMAYSFHPHKHFNIVSWNPITGRRRHPRCIQRISFVCTSTWRTVGTKEINIYLKKENCILSWANISAWSLNGLINTTSTAVPATIRYELATPSQNSLFEGFCIAICFQ